ncbi:hypothetical protein BDS110ZK12_27620 [Bradyrhizobium diazoefficiens]|uniref:Uncharacterized protein n=1 Tax=Bradyrhizobium diazoefficiens TaxID=1355477 RepID=A0A810BIE8_9BRAD|nr:hypothetical protein XF8B_65930 [Bradyrhizobium diazoefficiens]BCF37580.1 hypothetical protein XF15B_66510 [Bradyrhizobium diazoefficiens]BCF46258.1 hypothetical protein XF16B_67480 [Bradyrhizobium diazoefficiens]BCF72411.1 hypothetical protein XF19B_67640 [Bradyrhizobium diazoefficiens]
MGYDMEGLFIEGGQEICLEPTITHKENEQQAAQRGGAKYQGLPSQADKSRWFAARKDQQKYNRQKDRYREIELWGGLGRYPEQVDYQQRKDGRANNDVPASGPG